MARHGRRQAHPINVGSKQPEKEDYKSGGVAFIEGQHVKAEDAKPSIFDMGFTRSDVVYDVVSSWKNLFFRLDDRTLKQRQAGSHHVRTARALLGETGGRLARNPGRGHDHRARSRVTGLGIVPNDGGQTGGRLEPGYRPWSVSFEGPSFKNTSSTNRFKTFSGIGL